MERWIEVFGNKSLCRIMEYQWFDSHDPAIAKLLVIGLTASVLTGERERYLAAGMDSVLAKPINVDEVCSEIASFNNNS